ncbi:hypothetical protein GCM10010103_77360 [Streptomyces paradoxus]
MRLDAAEAGSAERPYYRREGHDFPTLMERLAPYVPKPGSVAHSVEQRFTQAQATAYHDRVLGALAVQGPDPMVDLPLRASEFDAQCLRSVRRRPPAAVESIALSACPTCGPISRGSSALPAASTWTPSSWPWRTRP